MATPIARSLGQTAFDWHDCLAALRGQALPLNLGNTETRLCVVSGLRKHLAFACSAEVDELCNATGQEIFARARNAGMIQNDQLPKRELLWDRKWLPYCIWYPRLASEDTYRRLVAISPEMRYQVGRACAVGGYSKLYSELDLLPDPTIAEEARENTEATTAEGAQRIYRQIMAAPTRYAVMNDYNRTVEFDEPRPGACLNADTAVLSTVKQRFQVHRNYPSGSFIWKSPRYFDITEDKGVDERDIDGPSNKLTELEAALLESPLPFNLPTVRKDLLILMAAFEGNVDRYARLRRPGRVVQHEMHCVLHGIYKSTAMAHWLERNPDLVEQLQADYTWGQPGQLKRAIWARRVMNNDIRRLLDADPPVPDSELPYWIWYPTVPDMWTLYKLAKARPAMRPQCARACIAANMQRTYELIMDMRDEDGSTVLVDRILLEQAQTCTGREFFEPDLQRRGEKQETPPEKVPYEDWKRNVPWLEADKGSVTLLSSLTDSHANIDGDGYLDWGMYEQYGVDMGRVRLYLSSPPEERARAQIAGGQMDLDEEDGLPCLWGPAVERI